MSGTDLTAPPITPIATTLVITCSRCGERVARARFTGARKKGVVDWSQARSTGIDLTMPGVAELTCHRCGRDHLQVSVDRVRDRIRTQWTFDDLNDTPSVLTMQV